MNPAISPISNTAIPSKTQEADVLAGTLGLPEMQQPPLAPPVQEFSTEAWLKSQAEEFQSRALAKNTVRGYETDWSSFSGWCAERGYVSLAADANTLTIYMVDRSRSLTKASLSRAIAAISRYHRLAGHPSPTVDSQFRDVMRGIRRSKTEPQISKRALVAEDLFEVLASIPGLKKHEAVELRDRALLAIGFTGALRRSELVALDVKDIARSRQGMVLNLRSSKTDQESAGASVAIPRGRKPSRCPVTMLEAWLDCAGITEGPIFRPVQQNGKVLSTRLTGRSVALIVKRHVVHAGFTAEEFSGHSLRSGLATSAAAAGQNERDIMTQTRHKSVEMVRRYIQKGTLFQSNVVSALDF